MIQKLLDMEVSVDTGVFIAALSTGILGFLLGIIGGHFLWM